MNPNEAEKIAAAVTTPGLVALVAAIFGGVVLDRYKSWREWLKGLMAATLVGMSLGLWFAEGDIGRMMQLAIVAICGFVAYDILAVISALASMARSDPFGTFERIRTAWRGKQ